MDPSDPAHRDFLRQLQAQQLAFFERRLRSPAAQDEWRRNVADILQALLEAPLASVVSADALIAFLDETLALPVVRDAVAPVLRAVLPTVLAELQQNDTPLRSFVTDDALDALNTLAANPGWLSERLVREITEHEAIERVMHDVLSEVVNEFSEKVNPVTAEWGLPALLRRLVPLGFGTVSKQIDALQAELRRRLEPETRKFLQLVTRRALRKAADVTLATQGEPHFVALKHELTRWFLTQSTADLLAEVGVLDPALFHRVALPVLGALVSRETLREQRASMLRAFLQEHGHRTVNQLLATFEISYRPACELAAEATWPLLETALGSAPVRAWIAALLDEFYDEVRSGWAGLNAKKSNVGANAQNIALRAPTNPVGGSRRLVHRGAARRELVFYGSAYSTFRRKAHRPSQDKCILC